MKGNKRSIIILIQIFSLLLCINLYKSNISNYPLKKRINTIPILRANEDSNSTNSTTGNSTNSTTENSTNSTTENSTNSTTENSTNSTTGNSTNSTTSNSTTGNSTTSNSTTGNSTTSNSTISNITISNITISNLTNSTITVKTTPVTFPPNPLTGTVVFTFTIETTGTSASSSNGTDVRTASNSTIVYKSSSSGLSTGAICAIAIPCIAGVIGAAAAAALLKGGIAPSPVVQPTLPPPNYIDTSLGNLNVAQEIPVQPVVEVPQPVQPVVVQPEPLPEPQIIRPNYPVNRVIEPPVVNRAFQPMIPTQQVPLQPPVQQVQMVPVQQVQMVPVQQVEMVPVNEIVPVNQVTEVAPQITQISEVPNVASQVVQSDLVASQPVVSQAISQVPQIIEGGVQPAVSVLPSNVQSNILDSELSLNNLIV